MAKAIALPIPALPPVTSAFFVHLEIHKASLRLNTAMTIYQGFPGAISCQSPT
jgi:hypothetical protein